MTCVEQDDGSMLLGEKAGGLSALPLISVSDTGRILEVTPAAAHVLSIDVGRMTGLPISRIFPELGLVARHMKSKRVVSYARRGNGSRLPVNFSSMHVATSRFNGWLIHFPLRLGAA
jgi:hypothetical protein